MYSEFDLMRIWLLVHKTYKHFVYLPYSDNSIGDEDKKDDKRFNKGCDCPLPFFEPSQGLWDRVKDRKRWTFVVTVALCYWHSFHLCLWSRVTLMQQFVQITQSIQIANLLMAVITCVCECVCVCSWLCTKLCFLTKEMHAANSKIRTKRSSNCSRTSSHSDFPASRHQGTQWAAVKSKRKQRQKQYNETDRKLTFFSRQFCE